MMLIEKLKQMDERVFHFVNQELSHPVLDQIMVFVSGKLIWLFLALIWFFYMLYKRHWLNVKKGLLVAASLGVADLVAFNLLKPYFGRPRPCKILSDVHFIDGCGGFFSFPSNHATNAFVVAFMLTSLAGKLRWSVMMYTLAVIIGFSRVYLGVHYPGDIVAGFFFGSLIGYLGLAVGKRSLLKA